MGSEPDKLMADYLDAATDAGQEEQLAARLARSHEDRTAAAHAALVDRLTRELHRAPLDPDSVLRGLPRASEADLSDKVMRRLGTASRRPGSRLPVLQSVRGWGWRITATAALLLVGLGVLIRTQWDRLAAPVRQAQAAVVARAEQVHGDVGIVRAGGTVAAQPGTALRTGDRLVVGAGSARVVLRETEDARLEFTAGASAAFERDRPPTRTLVRLERGRLLATVAARDADRALQVRTAHADVFVVGTRFAVSVEPATTRVDVHAGSVRVRARRTGRERVVPAGSAAVVDSRVRLVPVSDAARRRRRPGSGLLALYLFREGRGPLVRDVSGVGAALDLRMDNASTTRWVPGGGLEVRSPTRIASDSPAVKIAAACRRSRELTVEVWVTPGKRVQGRFSRIATMSVDAQTRNFALGQFNDRYLAVVRTSETDAYGAPRLVTAPCAALKPTHLVFTMDRQGLCRLYIDGRPVAIAPSLEPGQRGRAQGDAYGALAASFRHAGDFRTWDDRYRFALGRELQPWHDEGAETIRSWLGTYHLVAVYSRALEHAEIRDLYEAGPAEPEQPRARPEM